MRDHGNTSLLPAVIAGDPLARDRFVAEWGPVVLRWCCRLGGPRVDPEDAAHDVIERVLERLHTLREPRAFGTWLFHSTRHVVADHRRRAWVRRWVPGLLPERPDPTEGAMRRIERDETARRVQAALDALPADLREVLVLCELEERNGAEAAELLAVPLGTVKSRLRRARAAFAEEARRRGLAPDSEALSDAADEVSG